MKNFSKPYSMVTKFLITVFLTMTVMQGILPSITTRAAETPEQATIGDGLTITWYDAKRATPQETQRAMAERDKSKKISTGKFTEGFYFDVGPNWADPWRWAEITGFIKMPDPVADYWEDNARANGVDFSELPIGITNSTKARVMLKMDGKEVLDAWEKPVPIYGESKPPIGSMMMFEYELKMIPSVEGQYQYINLCIGKNENIWGPYNTLEICYAFYDVRFYFNFGTEFYGIGTFLSKSFYTTVPVAGLKESVIIDDEKNIVTIDKYGVDVSQYEYGIKSDEDGYTTFKKGPNYFGNKSGILMVREKGNPASVEEIGPVTLDPPTELKIVSQNDREVNLTWKYPFFSAPNIKEFVVCRTGPVPRTILNQGEKGIVETIATGPGEIGRTAALSFTDKNITPGRYTYYVKAIDNKGNQSSPIASEEISIIPSLKLVPNALTLDGSNTQQLSVVFDADYTGNRSGTWSVSDGGIASVEGYETPPIQINMKHAIPGVTGAKVTGLKPGTTTVTFTHHETGVTLSVPVTVKPGYSIAPNPITVYEGETGSLSANYDYGYVGSRVGRWTVDDNTVASIDQNGVVTGKKTGTAIACFVVMPGSSSGQNSPAAADGAVAVRNPFSLTADKIAKTATILVKPSYYTVTFSGANPNPPAVTVRHDTPVPKPSDPTPADKNIVFVGWSASSGGGQLWNFNSDKVTQNMTLYAHWAVRVLPPAPPPPPPSSVAPTITGSDTINLTAGYADTQQTYTLGGSPAPTLSITANTAGATLSGNILTIPAGLTAGTYSVTLTAANGVSPDATKTVTVAVAPAPPVTVPPGITGAGTINLTEGYAAKQETYTLSGTPAPTLSITANTAGATLSGNTLTVPAGLTAGTYSVTLTAANGVSPDATKTVTVNVYPTITINFASQIDVILSHQTNAITAYGGNGGPYTFALASGSMPAGLTLNSNGTITKDGTVTTGVYPSVTVTVTDSIGNTFTTVSMAVVVVP